MSYVEKALYQYIKEIFVGGFKVLFNKKYIAYTIIFLASITSTTTLYVYQAVIGTPSQQILTISSLFLRIELALALAFFIFGLISSRYPTYMWAIPAVILAAGITIILYYLPLKGLLMDFSPYIALFFYLAWIMLSILLYYSLTRNFFGSKVLGSALFMGKKKDEGGILFGGIVFIITLVNTGLAAYLIYLSVPTFFTPNKQIFLFSAAIASLLASLIIMLIVLKLGKYDDVFYTIISFFYIFTSYILWKLVYYYATNPIDQPITITNTDVIVSVIGGLFWAIYSVSSYGRKIKNIHQLDEEIRRVEKILEKESAEYQKEFERIKAIKIPEAHINPDDSWLKKRKKQREVKKKEREKERELKKFKKKKKVREKSYKAKLEEARKETEERIRKSKEKWFLFRIPEILGPDGVLLTIMGMILGYHVTNIQFLSKEDIFTSVGNFSSARLFGIRDKFAVIFITITILLFLFAYETSEKFRTYSSPNLYRLEILPSFEELMKELDKIRAGEATWQDYAKALALKAAKGVIGGAATKVFVRPTKAASDAVTSAYKGLKNKFKNRKKNK